MPPPQKSVGWTLREAIRRTADPELLANWIEAAKTYKKSPTSLSRIWRYDEVNGYPSWVVRQRARESMRFLDVRAKFATDIERGLRSLLKGEDLIAYGRRGSPIAEHQVIPASAWDALRVKRFNRSLLSERNKDRVEIFDVRIFPTLESEAASQYLLGRTIVEAFECFVFGSPDIIQKQRRSVANGGCPLALGTEHRLFQAIWPVHVESWFASVPVGLCEDVRERARSAGVDRFLSRRFDRLVDYLARGEIVAEGLSASGGLCRIPGEEWYGAGRLLDLAKGNLLESAPNNSEPYRVLFSGLRLVKPGDDERAFHVKPIVCDSQPSDTTDFDDKNNKRATHTGTSKNTGRKRPSAQWASTVTAIEALWNGAVPTTISAKTRDRQITEWQRANNQSVASSKTISRVISQW
jgi:hypothetical protein